MGSRAAAAAPRARCSASRAPRTRAKPPVQRITSCSAAQPSTPSSTSPPRGERLGETARVEALADRPRVPRLLPHDRRALRLEPLERVVETLPDEPLERSSPAGHSRTERRPSRGGARPRTDDRSIEPPMRVPFSRTTTGHAELAQAARRRRARPCRPRRRDHYVSENVGLCSTYSIRTRSGPQRNAAYVFAASTTDSTSIPRSPASAITSSAESTSTARWFRSGRSGSPGSPSWNSMYAPPTSTRRVAGGREAVALVLAAPSPAAIARPERDVVEVVLDVGLRLDERQRRCPRRRRTRSGCARRQRARERRRGRRRAGRRASTRRARAALRRRTASACRGARRCPSRVKFSSCAITCMPRWRSRNATIGARSATQKAT